ncbi:hypothetical protein NDU88_001463 [Pleurodeles waltl]|uniref:Uncharacterized protein n=1 Tax=Pleurodeles waltl TaxID=8319 RepID=A0AAV7KPN2_PLEWA|nr:hypothetical protein NDU88_001463 [Pleurodeles waltl]
MKVIGVRPRYGIHNIEQIGDERGAVPSRPYLLDYLWVGGAASLSQRSEPCSHSGSRIAGARLLQFIREERRRCLLVLTHACSDVLFTVAHRGEMPEAVLTCARLHMCLKLPWLSMGQQ